MNPIQRQLLEFADTIDLGTVTAYSLAKKLGINHPYKIQFALEQLTKKGLLVRNKRTGSIAKPEVPTTSGFISIPYYGEVNCGEALALADDTIKGYLKVSPSTLHIKSLENLVALKATGQSMNDASINGLPIEDGDYVIARRINPTEAKNGDYVVSIIDGAANLKLFHKDDHNERILLLSKSTYDYPPIVISREDADETSTYLPIAKAVEVIPV